MSDHRDGVKSISELDQVQVYPETGGLSGIEDKNFDKLTLKLSKVSSALIPLGTLFHSFGPLTANELS